MSFVIAVLVRASMDGIIYEPKTRNMSVRMPLLLHVMNKKIPILLLLLLPRRRLNSDDIQSVLFNSHFFILFS